MTFKVLLSCLCMILFTLTPTQDKGWRGIVPLHSTRADVERLLGPSAKPDGYAEIYDLGEEAVFIEYSSGPCRKDRKGGYNVPSGTVVQIRVSSSTSPEFSALNLDLSKYEKGESKLPGVVYYTNMEEGIAYQVQDGKVGSINYFPAKKDHHLSCSNFTVKRPCNK